MSILKAKEYLKKFNMQDKIIELSESTETVKLAALAINCKEGEIAKSLSFLLDEKPILILFAGDVKVDNAKYKTYFGKKASMIKYEDVERFIGHAPGGVCPFGINEDVRVYLDNSLKEYKFVYPACGSSNSMIKLSIEELEKVSNYTSWIDVSKKPLSNE